MKNGGFKISRGGHSLLIFHSAFLILPFFQGRYSQGKFFDAFGAESY